MTPTESCKQTLTRLGAKLETIDLPGIEAQKAALLNAIRICLANIHDQRRLALYFEKWQLFISAYTIWKTRQRVAAWLPELNRITL
jgi:hypothetical protein